MATNGSDLTAYDYYWNVTEASPRWSAAVRTLWENGRWEIALYSVIFLLSVVGNALVMLTLGQNNRLRTVTNVFLLNLAASDLVLAVLCMPFTLIGTLLRDFIFGKWMCKLVPFLQATSVAASVWTLVALSVERYYAICHPLRSRKWQTPSHARRLIVSIWVGGAVAMLPVAVLSELQPTRKGRHKCRENWPDGNCERAYNLFLDVLLLVVPLLALAATYALIATTLWRDLEKSKRGNARFAKGGSDNPRRGLRDRDVVFTTESAFADGYGYVTFNSNAAPGFGTDSEQAEASFRLRWMRRGGRASREIPNRAVDLRHTNYERSLVSKQRVIKMLFVVVLEFFICWTPLYVINTLALFRPQLVYDTVGYKTISFCQLLAYTSGCCNPITYCFMNKGFRTSFVNMFACRKGK